MREWPVRGLLEACDGNKDIAEGCIRSYKGDGQGVMGFFVAGFVRDGLQDGQVDIDGPYVRDEEGKIIRDQVGMPVLKSTGQTVELLPKDESEEESDDESDEDEDESGMSDDDDHDEEEWDGFGDD